MQEAVAKEAANIQEVGGDEHIPMDAVEQDPSVQEGDLAVDEDEAVDKEGEPEGDVLEPLPEQEATLDAAAQAGDEAAALELARWQELKTEGKLVRYGTATSSPASSYGDDDSTYDLVEEEDLASAVAESLMQLKPQPKSGGGESSKAAEERAFALVATSQLRQLKPEPEDDAVQQSPQLEKWPTLDQHVPVTSWHSSRFVFDNRGRLVLPPGPAHPMYGFLPSARTEVSQLELSDPLAQKFLKSGRAGPGRRPGLDFTKIAKSYHLWDPRLQNLLSQVETTAEGKQGFGETTEMEGRPPIQEARDQAQSATPTGR